MKWKKHDHHSYKANYGSRASVMLVEEDGEFFVYSIHIDKRGSLIEDELWKRLRSKSLDEAKEECLGLISKVFD